MNTRGLIVSSMMAAAALLATACDSSPIVPGDTPRAEYSQTDVRVGSGSEAVSGGTMTVNYTGWLYDPNGTDGKGAQFDTSNQAGRGPFSFVLGGPGVISGWNRGVLGMRVGGLRRFVLPPELAYGAQGNPPAIPPNATLVFEVELLSIQ